jgi:hypothetical protein
MLAVILGTAEGFTGGRRAIGESCIHIAGELKNDFEVELLHRQFYTQPLGLTRASLSLDTDDSFLLTILCQHHTLTVFHIAISSSRVSMEMRLSLENVGSYAHVRLPLCESVDGHILDVPTTLVLLSTNVVTIFIGTTEMQSTFSLNVMKVGDLCYGSLLPGRVDEVENLTIRTIGETQHRSCYIHLSIGVEQLFLKLLPLLPTAVSPQLVAALVECLPVSLAADALVLLMSSYTGVCSELALLLAAFDANEAQRHFCSQLTGLSCPAAVKEATVRGGVSLPCVFDALHALSGEYILRGQCYRSNLDSLLRALLATSALIFNRCKISQQTGALDVGLTAAMYFDHYNRLLGYPLRSVDSLACPQDDGSTTTECFFTKQRHVPCVFQWMYSQLAAFPIAGSINLNLPGLEGLHGAAFITSKYTFTFLNEINKTAIVNRCAKVHVVSCLNAFLINLATKLGVKTDDPSLMLQVLHFSAPVRAIVEQALFLCSEEHHPGWIVALLLYMKRDDIILNDQFVSSRGDNSHSQIKADVTHHSDEGPKGEDGFDDIERIAYLRFPDDRRITEVARLLRSSRSLYLRLPRSADSDEPTAYRHKQQVKLLALCRRSLAGICGRGMLTMGSMRPLLGEILPVPPLALKGRCPPNNTIVVLDLSTAPADLTLWPEFHNGVAAGLRLNPAGQNRDCPSQRSVITRSWVMYNRTHAYAKEPNSAAHAGFLLVYPRSRIF